jgi:hypothetical protein
MRATQGQPLRKVGINVRKADLYVLIGIRLTTGVEIILLVIYPSVTT